MDQELISQTALDQMVSSDQTQLIKAAVPYLPPSARQIISLYTKLEELSNTMALFSPGRTDMQICENTAADPVEMLQDMVVAAVNEAMRAAQNAANAGMSKLTGGLNLGFRLITA